MASASEAEWEQMLGRGPRLCPDINISKFVVFECFDGTLIQYFRNADEEDFELTPLLQGRGGVAKAKRVFGELNLLVAQLNEAVAA